MSAAVPRVAVVGAGVGGLVAAGRLAAEGLDVVLVERALGPGGKMRRQLVGGQPIDVGPTVVTMRDVLELVFAEAGSSLGAHLTLHRAAILARHAWPDGTTLDLHADLDRAADAIGRFAGTAEAAGYRRFCAHAAAVHRTLDVPFMQAARPSLDGLVAGVGLGGVGGLVAMQPFATLWGLLGGYFRDPRLRQLFGRYATYCGASPFEAPATLALIAHVERLGVWLIEGGMGALAAALANLAALRGARFRYTTEALSIETAGGRVTGLTLAGGERLAADAIVVNADTAACAVGLLGPAPVAAVPARLVTDRSLSAVTWAAFTTTQGFPLERHNVFFSSDYAAEFRQLRGERRLPDEPTVYVCAQDRGHGDPPEPGASERLLCLVNAPADGDTHPYPAEETAACASRTEALLARCGLRLSLGPATSVATTPKDFAALFPATGGALYGPATHGWRAAFARPSPRTRLPGLYLAGGSVHPGPGVPMAALSGRMAATCLLADLQLAARARPSTSPSRSPRTATSGGTSMR